MVRTARAHDERMSFDEFLDWSSRQEGRYELFDGYVLKMASETAGHVRVKQRAANALREAIERAGLPCEAFGDGMTVRIDERRGYEPDALVHCGEPIDDDSLEAPSPVVVVEVVSPTSGARDTNAKLLGYFRVPGLRHYLVVIPNERRIVHYRREDDAADPTIAPVSANTLHLYPPGLDVDVESFFPPRADA